MPAFALGVRLFACCQVMVVGGVAATHVVWEKEEQSLALGERFRFIPNETLNNTLNFMKWPKH